MKATTFLYILVVIVAGLFIVQQAQAQIAEAAAFFVLGQLANDQRQLPTNHDTVGLNPIYNVKLEGKQVGGVPDAKVIVAASMRGCTLIFEPGNMGKVDIIGFEMTSTSPCMPPKCGVYANPETIQKYYDFDDVKEKFTAQIHLEEGQNMLVNCHPRFGKWQIPICTEDFSDGLFIATVRVWYVQRVNSGFLRLGRSTVIQREETVVRFFILDPDYMARAINDVGVQNALRFSAGLTGGPTQISSPQYVVDPKVKQQLDAPLSGGEIQDNVPRIGPSEEMPPYEATSPPAGPPRFEERPTPPRPAYTPSYEERIEQTSYRVHLGGKLIKVSHLGMVFKGDRLIFLRCGKVYAVAKVTEVCDGDVDAELIPFKINGKLCYSKLIMQPHDTIELKKGGR